MKPTPHFFKREDVKKVFDKVLKRKKTLLSPISIAIQEGPSRKHGTITNFSFQSKGVENKVVTIANSKGSGFVDCLFGGLHDHYAQKYPSLEKIKLLDFMVRPNVVNKNTMGTDSKLSVLFRVNVQQHGPAEFQNASDSVIHSCFTCALDAFQFYINCERSFNKLQVAVTDAQRRNRGDITQNCLTSLSKLTEANTYEKKGKKN